MISLILCQLNLCQLCRVKDRGEKGNHSCEVQEVKGRMKNTSILYSSPTSSRAAFCHLNKIKCFSKILKYKGNPRLFSIWKKNKEFYLSLFLCYHPMVS